MPNLARRMEFMKARIIVTLKSGVLDPQGKAIESALARLAFAGVASLRQGKVFDVEIAARRQGRRAREASRRLAKSCSPTP